VEIFKVILCGLLLITERRSEFIRQLNVWFDFEKFK